MTREEAIERLEDTFEGWERWNPHNDSPASKLSEALGMAISALREQEERSKACPYCDVAKANEGVRNTVLWVKEPETNKWTMMGKKLLFCPMCGRRLEEV